MITSISQNTDSMLITFLLSLTHVIVEKILFFGQIFEIEILVDLHVMRTSEYEKHICSIWFVCVSVISITQKQIIAGTLNLVFYICILHRCYFKLFYKDRIETVHRGTQKNSNAVWPMEAISCYWNFTHLDCIKYNKINVYFYHDEKHVNNRIGYEGHSKIVYRVTKRNSNTWVIISENCWMFISCYFV